MSPIDDILQKLGTSPCCSVKGSDGRPVPGHFPDEVQAFFSRTSGGRLFYDRDYSTPMFGCELGLRENPVSKSLGFDEDQGYCEGYQFSHIYPIADYDETGDYTIAAVSTLPESFGHIYTLSYGLGDPTLTWSDVTPVARSLTRWLAIHIEAWEVYQEDWREGLRHFGALISAEQKATRITP